MRIRQEKKMNSSPTLLIRLLVGVLATITIYPNTALALPLDVEVLDRSYTTLVSTTFQRFIGDSVITNSISREISSSTPHDDSLVREGRIEATAQASQFAISAFTATLGFGGGTFGVASTAAATSEMLFVPVVSGVGEFVLDFRGYFEYFFSEGSVRLFDVTSNEQLWSYGWHGFQGSVPWVDDTDGPARVMATLTLPTLLLSTHTYEFSMFTTTTSNPPDSEMITINLSGLKPRVVAEPPSLLLFSYAVAGLSGVAWRRVAARAKEPSAGTSQDHTH
jgi:hypothetical protein